MTDAIDAMNIRTMVRGGIGWLFVEMMFLPSKRLSRSGNGLSHCVR
jgi:hypothetical protein